MKFVYNIYVLIFILKSTWEVQNAADFTLDELTHLSQELNPIECMRLLESIYLAIPKAKEYRIVREISVNKCLCLNELRAWNQQFFDKTEPKARDVMFLHLNALGRADLAKWVRKNRVSLNPVFSKNVHFQEENEEIINEENKKISKSRIFKRDINENRPNHHINTKRITHRAKRAKIHYPIIASISEEVERNERHASASKNQSVKWKHGMSRNWLFLMIGLGIVVIFICGIGFLMFRRSLRNSMCCNEQSYLSPGNDITNEKGLQCMGCLDDNDDFASQTSCTTSQISEIDIEGVSCINSIGIDSRKIYSETVLCEEKITPNISVEKLELLNEKSDIEVTKETQPLSSCRCRPLEQKICGPIKPKRKKKKAKIKPKEETKSTKNYLKSMQEKILPRKRRQIKKDCTFDMKQFQDKILTLLNQECGVCQCCNCTPHWEVVASKMKNRSTREEERCIKPKKKECKKEHKPKQDKCENLTITKGCNKEVLTYQASVTSKSPMSGRRSSKEQKSESPAKKCKIKTKEKSRKLGSSRTKKAKDDKVLLLSSSSSDIDQSEKQSKFRSRRSKELDESTNTLLSAHDKPKRFY